MHGGPDPVENPVVAYSVQSVIPLELACQKAINNFSGLANNFTSMLSSLVMVQAFSVNNGHLCTVTVIIPRN